MDTVLSGLGNRTFLMHNVHDSAPVVFQTRWALSYLSGPLTRDQIKRLTGSEGGAPKSAEPMEPMMQAQPAPTPSAQPAARAGERPVAPEPIAPPPDLPQFFLPLAGSPQGAAQVIYRPALVATVDVRYSRASPAVDYRSGLAWVAGFATPGSVVQWEQAVVMLEADLSLAHEPAPLPAEYAPLPGELGDLDRHAKALTTFIYQSMPLRLWKCPALKGVSEPGETEGQFRARMSQIARERRDQAVARARAQYADRLASIQRRIQQAEDRIARERAEHGQQSMQTAVAVGATLVGALFGRKVLSRRNVDGVASAMRRAGRTSRSGQEVEEAEVSLEREQARLAELEAEFQASVAELDRGVDATRLELELVEIKPKKADIVVQTLGLLWGPWAVDQAGPEKALFSMPRSARKVTDG